MRLLFLIFAITLLVPTTTSRANGADPYLRATDLQNLPEPSIDTSLYPLNCSLHVEEWLPLSFSFAGQAASSKLKVASFRYLMLMIIFQRSIIISFVSFDSQNIKNF